MRRIAQLVAFGCLTGSPAAFPKVHSSVKVRVSSIPAGATRENRLRRTVQFFSMSTLRTFTTGIARVHENQLDSSSDALVRDELLQLVERPGVQDGTLREPSKSAAVAYVDNAAYTYSIWQTLGERKTRRKLLRWTDSTERKIKKESTQASGQSVNLGNMSPRKQSETPVIRETDAQNNELLYILLWAESVCDVDLATGGRYKLITFTEEDDKNGLRAEIQIDTIGTFSIIFSLADRIINYFALTAIKLRDMRIKSILFGKEMLSDMKSSSESFQRENQRLSLFSCWLELASHCLYGFHKFSLPLNRSNFKNGATSSERNI